MIPLLQFVASIEYVLYGLAGIGVFFSIRRYVLARRVQRVAIFGLEREDASNRARGAVNTIAILIGGCIVVYILAHILTPIMVSAPTESEATPVTFIDVEPTPTTSILLFPTVTPTLVLGAPESAQIETGEVVTNGCEIFGSTIVSPAPGDVVSGQVLVEGQANVLNFASYKFEVKGPSTDDQWVVVATYTTPQAEGALGTFDSTSLLPGSYELRLITFLVDGSNITPCIVPITISGTASQ